MHLVVLWILILVTGQLRLHLSAKVRTVDAAWELHLSVDLRDASLLLLLLQKLLLLLELSNLLRGHLISHHRILNLMPLIHHLLLMMSSL